MLKIIFISILSTFCINLANAQNSFKITIKLDSSISTKNMQIQYYDGKNTTFLPDTFGNARTFVFKSEYYSPLASFTISYTDSAKNFYGNDFFLNNKPAIINFHFTANKENKLGYTYIQNATPIYDTVSNKIWVKYRAFMTDSSMTKENEEFDAFLKNHPGFVTNDSLNNVFKKYYKIHINRVMRFLKQYANNYFSFWYFINQVAQPGQILRKDTAYLKEQLAYIKTVFPAKFTGSVEGQELIKNYAAAINSPPLKLNEAVPPFTITTIDGKKISLKDLRGKYVLLDFWATWCGPCLAEMPFVKGVRKNYPDEKLVIVGVSSDYDSKKFIEFVKQENMNWPQFYDKNRVISKLYGVDAIPLMVLINKEGKMIYKSDFKQTDQNALPKVLESIN
jgi:thiol-disulfide isomerase/thioredoxin